jgi:hypothetical protein
MKKYDWTWFEILIYVVLFMLFVLMMLGFAGVI